MLALKAPVLDNSDLSAGVGEKNLISRWSYQPDVTPVWNSHTVVGECRLAADKKRAG